ncbi:MAG: hypothetical protein HC862_02450 [Scytonema sp. RU_4_4]|nr:hypothetical protein [Scytonema sp. RU_4_4]
MMKKCSFLISHSGSFSFPRGAWERLLKGSAFHVEAEPLVYHSLAEPGNEEESSARERGGKLSQGTREKNVDL